MVSWKAIPTLVGFLLYSFSSLADTSDYQQRFQFACKLESETICTGKTDQREIYHCLQSNEARISNKCSGFLAEMHRHIGQRQAEGKWKNNQGEQNGENSAEAD